jgi:IPT/TIG domain
MRAMTPFKRHLGRRVAGIGVAAASVVIGLEPPAFAVSPTITSFSPTSGPTGCVVVIRGTNFKNPIVTSVDIGGKPVSEFKVVSGKEIWATVAGDASGTIHVTNASDTASGPTEFVNANPGDCSPTITYFTPCSGSPGFAVTIIGTNLLKSAGTTRTAPVGADVRFAPYTATATHTGSPESPRRLSVVVPSDTVDGPIRVSTFNDVDGEGAVLSGTQFLVPPPGVVVDCFPHARSITLSLRRHLVVRGMVSVSDGFTACAATVPVKIQRRVSGHWKTVGSATTTSTGAYKKRIPDKMGRYRARATRVALNSGADLCSRATSPVRRNT